MGDGTWSTSGCRPDVMWLGIPGQGCHYWTARFGQYFVGGVVYQLYAANRWECGPLGPPVKAYGFIGEFGGGEGMWFQGGVIVFRYQTRSWHIIVGDFGQTAGRLTDAPLDTSDAVELPLPDGDWSDLPNWRQPKQPKLTKTMQHAMDTAIE